MKQPLFIKKIWQKNSTHFSIHWNDNVIQDFCLRDLQNQCPCAYCEEHKSHPSIQNEKSKQNVYAVTIRNVGRYGIRIQFTSGCSMGIFHFDQLRQHLGTPLC